MEFELKQKNYHFNRITCIIVILGWKWFVKNPKNTIDSIFKEFYANVAKVIETIIVKGANWEYF